MAISARNPPWRERRHYGRGNPLSSLSWTACVTSRVSLSGSPIVLNARSETHSLFGAPCHAPPRGGLGQGARRPVPLLFGPTMVSHLWLGPRCRLGCPPACLGKRSAANVGLRLDGLSNTNPQVSTTGVVSIAWQS